MRQSSRSSPSTSSRRPPGHYCGVPWSALPPCVRVTEGPLAADPGPGAGRPALFPLGVQPSARKAHFHAHSPVFRTTWRGSPNSPSRRSGRSTRTPSAPWSVRSSSPTNTATGATTIAGRSPTPRPEPAQVRRDRRGRRRHRRLRGVEPRPRSPERHRHPPRRLRRAPPAPRRHRPVRARLRRMRSLGAEVVEIGTGGDPFHAPAALSTSARVHPAPGRGLLPGALTGSRDGALAACPGGGEHLSDFAFETGLGSTRRTYMRGGVGHETFRS